MNSIPEPAIGIDLGTTYSAAAYIDPSGRPRTLVNAEGDKLTPSMVLFDGDEAIVGKEAARALSTEGDRVASCVKRYLGERVFPQTLGGRQLPPETIQAFVLNKVRRDASLQVGAFERCVITVPAYFDEVRRKSTQDAGYIAGLEVLDIINEPTAAALAYAYQQGFMARANEDAQNILVYDLGGGTFDVTVMEVSGDRYTTLATDGDVHLGGVDWDQRLVDHISESCVRRVGIDPRDDPILSKRLWQQCEEAKRTLSARVSASVAFDIQGDSLVFDVTRDEFEGLTQDLLDRTRFTTRQTLAAAGLEWNEINKILLIGGSTRIPAVEAMLRELSGQDPDRSVSPDEAVAHGAALHAHSLLHWLETDTPQFSVTNVNSHSLGVVARDAKTKADRNAILIPRNTPLPVSAKRVFKTHTSAQQSVRVKVVEGESAVPEECAEIGRCSVFDLPDNLPAQTPVEVEFSYEANGRLTIVVTIAGRTIEHELVRPNTLTPEQLDSWRQHISGIPW